MAKLRRCPRPNGEACRSSHGNRHPRLWRTLPLFSLEFPRGQPGSIFLALDSPVRQFPAKFEKTPHEVLEVVNEVSIKRGFQKVKSPHEVIYSVRAPYIYVYIYYIYIVFFTIYLWLSYLYDLPKRNNV